MNTVAKIQELALPAQSNVKRIVLFGMGILAVSVSMYVYLVGKIVFDVVAERSADSSIRTSQSAISSLEVDYYGKIKTITLADAGSLGLSESHDTLYATRTADANTAFLTR